MSAISVRQATAADVPAVVALLESQQLTTAGVAAPLTGFLVADAGDRLVGVIGLERYDDYGLLRSAAVDASVRSQGVGRRLVERLLADAARARIREIYLLTTTAEDYFPRFGFARIARESVPAPVLQSVEFTTACPASATVMVRGV